MPQPNKLMCFDEIKVWTYFLIVSTQEDLDRYILEVTCVLYYKSFTIVMTVQL